MIHPDPIWLEIPEADQLRALAGTVLAVALVASVVVIALSAVAWGAHRAGWYRMGDGALANVGRAVMASVLIGALSGLVGWGSGLI